MPGRDEHVNVRYRCAVDPEDRRRTAVARRLAERRGRDDGAARRLRDVLRENTLAGMYSEGLLPGEGELMLTYGAARAVVREALSMLCEERVVERVRGIGTFAICEHRYAITLEEMHGDVAEDAESRRARPQVLASTVIPAPDAVAWRLGIAPGEPVLLLEYLGWVDGVVVWLASNYVRFPEADALLVTPFTSEWYGLLSRAGLTLGGSKWFLSATGADASVAGLLEIDPGSPVMLAEELIWDDSGRIYDFAICYFRGDRHTFVSSVGRSAMGDTSQMLIGRPAEAPSAAGA
jgi:GntR family transcriptional regulator